MTELILTHNFRDDLKTIYSNGLLDRIEKALNRIQTIPDISSSNVPKSIKQKWGDTVRILPVNPFDIVYTFHVEENLVIVHALIHQRSAH